MVDSLENEQKSSSEILIRRNFLSHSKKILEINGVNYNEKSFTKKLKSLIFNSDSKKPTFRQIIAKNIRDEKNRLQNTVKVLFPTTTPQEYEALYLFWFGIDHVDYERKQRLYSQKKVEDALQKKLRADSSLASIKQALMVLDRSLSVLRAKKDDFEINENYEADIASFNMVKAELSRSSTRLARLELRKELIEQSAADLDREVANIDTSKIAEIYKEARSLIPNLQRTFEETLHFHNAMVHEKKSFIQKELPELELEINELKSSITTLLNREKQLAETLKNTGAKESLNSILTELSVLSERKGSLEEQQRIWNRTIQNTNEIDEEIKEIDKSISSLDENIQQRVSEFNKFFSAISSRLYAEQFVLSPERGEKGYELNITSVSGNLGTGKKKGQMAAFDLAYIQYADSVGMKCLHFILQDQIENVHDNQITSLFTEIVSEINCQYVLSVLRDKLPAETDVEALSVLTLSQQNKLLRI